MESTTKSKTSRRNEGRGATSSPSVSAIKIDPVKVQIENLEVEEESPYLIGITDEAPFHVIYAGGMDFPRNEESVVVKDDGTTERTPQRGKVIQLSERRLEALKDAIVRRYVRSRGSSAIIHDTEEPRFSPRAGDVPLATYIYMIPVKDSMPHNWRTASHEPML